MQRVLAKFCEIIWTNMYYESLWNHAVTQQEVFNRPKITYLVQWITLKIQFEPCNAKH